MSLSLVQSAANTNFGTTSVSASWPAMTSTHHLLIAGLGINTSNSSLSPTKPSGWSEVVRKFGSNYLVILYHIPDPTTTRSGSESFDLGSSLAAAIILAEYSGQQSGGGALDATANASGSGTSSQSGAVSLSQDGEGLIAVIGVNVGGGTFSTPVTTASPGPAGGSFSQQTQASSSMTASSLALCHLLTNTTSTNTYSCSLTSTSGNWAGVIASYHTGAWFAAGQANQRRRRGGRAGSS